MTTSTVTRPIEPTSTVSALTELEVARVRTDGGTQSRARLDEFVIDEYAQLMLEASSGWANFPALIVYYDGENYWLADGFHRLKAAEQAGLTKAVVEVRQGARREAVLYSVGANAHHGLKRTNADKHRAVKLLLSDVEWGQWSDSEIARRCGVSGEFVRKLRPTVVSPTATILTRAATAERSILQPLEDSGDADPTPNQSVKQAECYPTERKVQRGGTVYTMQTARIGQSPSTLARTLPGSGEVPGATRPGPVLRAETVALLRHSPITESLEQKLALARLDPSTQLAVATKLAQGKATTLHQAHKEVKIERAVQREEQALVKFWSESDELPATDTAFADDPAFPPSFELEAEIEPLTTLAPFQVQAAAVTSQRQRRERERERERDWTVTSSQAVVECAAVITDPPYGVLPDQEWDRLDEAALQEFTRQWVTTWANQSGADSFLIFWSQRYLWQGRSWFDEALVSSGYQFQQLLIWHYPNGVKPMNGYGGFKTTYDPIFYYRREASTRPVRVMERDWNKGLSSFDCHVAATPQSNYTEAQRKFHPAQKPVSALEWLIANVSEPGELVADPFCGSGTTGIAARRLDRRFHGIETNPEYLALAQRRIAAYGDEEQSAD